MFFNRAAIYEMPHMILAAYMVTGFTVAGVYAAGILRGRRDRYHYTGFALGFVPAAVLTPFQIFVGDTAARAIAHDQPVKFASMEYVPRTSRHVPEWLGGVYVNGHVYGGVKIPDLDSLLVGFGPGTRVTGWDSVPPADRPPVAWLIHLCFDVMVGLGFLLLLAGLWALYEWWRRRRLPPQRLFWWAGAVSGVAAIVAMECGWVVTEVGRQPWVVYRLQTTAEAATTNGGVITSLSLVIVVYAVLGAATILILRMLSRRWRRGDAWRRPLSPTVRSRRRRIWRRAKRGADGRGRGRGDPAGRDHPVRGAGRSRLRRRPVGPAGRRHRARGGRPATLIDESITPVWEANHVWLVFDLVIFWTAFPHAFAAVMTTARAAAVARAGRDRAARRRRSPSARSSPGSGCSARPAPTFAFSSLLTPFFMGTVIGAIATGAVPATASHASLAAWTSPTALLAGFLFVAACGYLAAVYLTGEAARRGDQRLQAYFTRRAQAAAIVAGALSLAALAELHTSNPALYARLTGRALPLVITAGVCGLAVLTLLTIGRRNRLAAGSSPRSASPPSSGAGASPSTRCCCPAPR